MAFTVANWARASTSANEPQITVTPGGGNAVNWGCFRDYNYVTLDTQATVSASGYFNLNVAYEGVAVEIVTGDYVVVYSTTDGTRVLYRLTNTAGVITTSLASSGSVTSVVNLTAAQFIAAYATPVQLLASPGVGRAYTNVNATFSMTYGSAQFTTGGASSVEYGNTAHAGGTLATTTEAGATIDGLTASSFWSLTPATIAPAAIAVVSNLGLFLSNDTAAFAVGTGATFVVTTNANIVSV